MHFIVSGRHSLGLIWGDAPVQGAFRGGGGANLHHCTLSDWLHGQYYCRKLKNLQADELLIDVLLLMNYWAVLSKVHDDKMMLSCVILLTYIRHGKL